MKQLKLALLKIKLKYHAINFRVIKKIMDVVPEMHDGLEVCLQEEISKWRDCYKMMLIERDRDKLGDECTFKDFDWTIFDTYAEKLSRED